ncbi:MAG TPA: hypothetical protein VEC39_13975 [Vicinamibacterales bacterium]|nr:hypothetical protein [Vicinamibacterales bacterium]
MVHQLEELLRAGIWLGPAVLGSLCYRMLHAGAQAAFGEEWPGALMLATGAIVLTVAGTRFNRDKHAALGPAVFAVMFFVSWSMR